MIDILVGDTLTQRGFDIIYNWNTLQPPWSPNGWPLSLPNIGWKDNTRLVLHFQDRITPTESGCRELEQIENVYGSRANQIVVVFYTHNLDKIYTGPIQLVEYSTHCWLTVTELLNVKDRWIDAFNVPRTIDWQSLNGRICPHRRRVANVLKTWPNGILSCGTDIPLKEWDYSTYRGTENYDNFLRLLPVYTKTKVNIVTETDYDKRPGIISEKSLYAFIAGQVPIIIGHPGAVQDCRDLGFDMFDDLVNTTYDWMPNDVRAESALLMNQDLILGKKDLTPYQQRLQNNQQYALYKLLDTMKARATEDLIKVV